MTENDMSIKELYELLKKSQEEQTRKLTNEIHKTREEYSKKINKLEKEISELQDKNLDLERKARKNNIIVFGLKANKDNLLEETIEILNNTLDIHLEERYINDIFVIGKHENKEGVLIEFTSYLTKKYVFKNIHKLRNSRISIVNDLCQEDQNRKRILVKHLKAARSKNQKARIRGWKLEIEGKFYSLEELENTGQELDNNSSEEEAEDKEEPIKDKTESSENRKKASANNQKEKELKKHKETKFNLNTRSAAKKV